jgi:hypothetical protein
MNNNLKLRYLSLALIVFLIIGTIIGLTIWFVSKTNLTSSSQVIDSTGAIIEPKSESEQEQAALEEKLFKRLPIQEKSFEIKYRSKGDKYEVLLYQPYEIARTAFYDWISSNGYSTLPRTRFELVLK